MRPLYRQLAFVLTLALAGCASVSEFPTSAAEVDFDGEQGHTGWARTERTLWLRNTQLNEALLAAQQALAASQFALVKSDVQGAVVIGEHGATTNDRNIIAALYFRPVGDDVRVRIHVQASRGLGFIGYQVDPNWAWELETSLKGIIRR